MFLGALKPSKGGLETLQKDLETARAFKGSLESSKGAEARPPDLTSWVRRVIRKLKEVPRVAAELWVLCERVGAILVTPQLYMP